MPVPESRGMRALRCFVRVVMALPVCLLRLLVLARACARGVWRCATCRCLPLASFLVLLDWPYYYLASQQ